MATTKDKKKKVKHPHRKNETFNLYIYKVLKQINPEMGVTVLSMKILNSLIEDIFYRLALESSYLVKIGGGNTLDTRCMETAAKLVLIGEQLRKHGLIEARKAINKYNAEISKSKEDNNDDDGIKELLDKKKCRRSSKAGLVFPVGRIARYLKEGGYSKRIGGLAPVYMAAILEYLIAEVIELSANICKEQKKVRIIPKHIYIAIMKDDELSMLFNEVTFPQSPSNESLHWF